MADSVHSQLTVLQSRTKIWGCSSGLTQSGSVHSGRAKG
ncbi:hypothetical protein RN06_4680 [Mycobacterium tuberculosis variant bovis BCG]|nr:hypothetical protein RN06_4680 [Mycobacterium tuberculosis variant bovis BCG]SGO66324.1 Uncharacterised protein [Mycobacterium tuberculosis]